MVDIEFLAPPDASADANRLGGRLGGGGRLVGGGPIFQGRSITARPAPHDPRAARSGAIPRRCGNPRKVAPDIEPPPPL